MRSCDLYNVNLIFFYCFIIETISCYSIHCQIHKTTTKTECNDVRMYVFIILISYVSRLTMVKEEGFILFFICPMILRQVCVTFHLTIGGSGEETII